MGSIRAVPFRENTRMNSTKSCRRHTTFSDIRSNALSCGLLLAFILLVFPMNMTDATEEDLDKRAGFVGMRGKKLKGYQANMKFLGYPGYPEYVMRKLNENLARNSRSNSGFVGMRG